MGRSAWDAKANSLSMNAKTVASRAFIVQSSNYWLIDASVKL